MLKHEFKSQNHIAFPLFHELVPELFCFLLVYVQNKPHIPDFTGMQLKKGNRLLSFTCVQCCLGA